MLLPTFKRRCKGQPMVFLLLLLLIIACRMRSAEAQQTSPLRGQGFPSIETRDVFLSAYLDRLLNVDDQNYRFEATFVFYLSWNDSQAHYIIANNTARVAAGEYTCNYPCTDWAADISCCDDIYIPSFFFRNAYHFSQDRSTGYKIYALAPPNGSVLWSQVVQGEFYQPMDLSHFPFDSWDLLVELEFLDTSMGTHPGVVSHVSSGGTHLYTVGLGDAVSDWNVESINLSTADNINSGQLFSMSSSIPSNPRDPLPLGSGQAAVLRGMLPGISTTSRINVVRMVLVKLRITRFWRYHVLNTILPVALLGWISFVVFFLQRRDLGARLGVIVTLFLALAAVQFVISEHQPSSSYVLPTQQQVILTYALLALMAVESIVVYNIETWKEQTEFARLRRNARDKYVTMKRGQAASTADAAAAAVAAAEGDAAAQEGLAPPSPVLDKGGERSNGGHSSGQRSPAMASLKLTRIKSLQADMDYDAYCAFVVDRTALAVVFILYNLGTILIFTLQQGYINLFVGL